MSAYDDVANDLASGASSLTIACSPIGTPTGVGAGLGTLDFDSRTLSSATYAGTAMTLEDSYDTANVDTWLHGLTNPSSGNQNYVATFSGAVFRIKGSVITATGGPTTGSVFSAVAKATGSTGTATVDVASSASEFVMDVTHSNGTTSHTYPAGQTERYNSGVAGDILSTSTEEPGSATTTMSCTVAGGGDWWIIAGSFANAAAGGANRIRFPAQTSAMGVGGMLGGNRIH